MSDMVRKQIYITPRQEALLKRLSRERGMSEAEIIRQAIDQEASRATKLSETIRQQAWEQAKKTMLAMKERADEFQEPYVWNREEIYTERENRLLRNFPEVSEESE